MSACFVNPDPIGVNPPTDGDRRPIYNAYVGDEITLRTQVVLGDGTPATPENSILAFILTDQRFEPCEIWAGSWRNGAELLDSGLVEVKIPREVSETLRRGSFLFGMTVEDLHGNARRTVMAGSLLVEYAPTAPHHDIPYK